MKVRNRSATDKSRRRKLWEKISNILGDDVEIRWR